MPPRPSVAFRVAAARLQGAATAMTWHRRRIRRALRRNGEAAPYAIPIPA
jgi:hypothetical protein